MTLSQRQAVGAIFAPAVQPIFSMYVEHPSYRHRLFGESGWNVSDLNFLRCGSNFDLSVFLTSAHVYRDVKRHDITHVRRPGQTHIVDSGGYSLINSDVKARSIAMRMWKYQVEHADIAMTLDVPTATIDRGANSHYRTFSSCLTETVDLLKSYERWNLRPEGRRAKRRGLRWLNVLQGRDSYESRAWYEAVRGFDFNGWAFAGDTRRDLFVVISRLFDMFEDGLIPCRAWFHFLGMGSLRAFVILTAIRDGLRALMNDPNIQVSFDSADAFNSVSRFRQFYELDDWRPENLGVVRRSIPNDLSLIGSFDYTGIKGPLLPWMSWDDLAYDPTGGVSGRRAELGGLKNNLLFQHHNVWSQVTAFASVGDRLLLSQQRGLPPSLSADYDLVFKVVASGNRKVLAHESLTLSWIRL